jgi:hypothetical protein
MVELREILSRGSSDNAVADEDEGSKREDERGN